jgi:hypothetical protein
METYNQWKNKHLRLISFKELKACELVEVKIIGYWSDDTSYRRHFWPSKQEEITQFLDHCFPPGQIVHRGGLWLSDPLFTRDVANCGPAAQFTFCEKNHWWYATRESDELIVEIDKRYLNSKLIGFQLRVVQKKHFLPKAIWNIISLFAATMNNQ